MDELTKAYVAAFIDGEGTITISRARSTGSRREFTYRCRVLCVNSHGGVIQFLHDVTGVGLVYESPNAGKPEWSRMFRWQVTSLAARNLAAELAPWLVIKRAHAEVLAAFPVMPHGGRSTDSERIYAEQETLFHRMAGLNRRGAKPDGPIRDFPSDHPLVTNQYRVIRRKPNRSA